MSALTSRKRSSCSRRKRCADGARPPSLPRGHAAELAPLEEGLSDDELTSHAEAAVRGAAGLYDSEVKVRGEAPRMLMTAKGAGSTGGGSVGGGVGVGTPAGNAVASGPRLPAPCRPQPDP